MNRKLTKKELNNFIKETINEFCLKEYNRPFNRVINMLNAFGKKFKIKLLK